MLQGEPAAAAGTEAKDKSLFVPIAGPFIQLTRLDFAPSNPDSPSFAPFLATLLVLDGLAQAARATMLIAGLTKKRQTLVREDIAQPTLRLTPLTMGQGKMSIGPGLIGTM